MLVLSGLLLGASIVHASQCVPVARVLLRNLPLLPMLLTDATFCMFVRARYRMISCKAANYSAP